MFTISNTTGSPARFPTHKPWSGGSTTVPKLLGMVALSRLLSPLKFCSKLPEILDWIGSELAPGEAGFERGTPCFPGVKKGFAFRVVGDSVWLGFPSISWLDRTTRPVAAT